MALFNRWKNTVEKLTHPVVQEGQNTEVATEDEASIFAKAFLECLTNLEHRLHGMKEPKEIGLSALAAACDFYDADWCGVLDVDVKLKLWMPFWWFDRKTGGMSATKIDETGMVLLMLPAFLFAMYEKDGMPLEKVLLNIIRVKFLNPGIRPYETENLYSVLTEAEENSERK